MNGDTFLISIALIGLGIIAALAVLLLSVE